MRQSPYEKRVRELEAEGLTTSDAQGVADAEIMKAARGLTKTESRRAKFESLATDGWYAKHFKKLTQENLKFCRDWITEFGELPDGEWEHKCNMMWIDGRSGQKPKQGMVMLELLSVCRRGLS